MATGDAREPHEMTEKEWIGRRSRDYESATKPPKGGRGRDMQKDNAPAAYVDHYKGPRDQTLTTPREFFDKLNARYRFTLDGASEPHNALLENHSTAEGPRSWSGERVFCNPPWSDIPPFVELAAGAEMACLLVPARTNCRWFHRALFLGAHPEFWLGKLRFGNSKWNSPVDCLLLIFGAEAS